MAAADLQISENSFLVKYFDMVNAKLHFVWGHFQLGNPAMPFLQIYEGPYEIKKQIRPGTFIQWNPASKEETGMFHSPDLKIYKKREDSSLDKEDSE